MYSGPDMSPPPDRHPQDAKRYRIGIDVGGTHTDMVLCDSRSGAVRIEKLPTTPHNPSIAVLDGLRRFIAAGVAPDEIDFFAHGTTVTTNALLELKGAPLGLLINSGMRGILEVQTQGRDGVSPFDHYFRRPAPLVRPRFIHEIGGRMDYRGSEIEPLDEAAVRAAASRLAQDGAKSFCISFLFSFMNPAHEARAAAIVRDAVPGAVVSRSSAVLPRIREWPRLSTTLLNAYLAPVLARYTGDLAAGLDGLGVATRRRFLMQSNGGVMPLVADPETHTVRTLLSGPAAGVGGAGYLLGKRLGWDNLITVDIGGTSCDIAFIQKGEPIEQAEGTIEGRIVAVPALDITTISAGGGSIARVNDGGMLEVGPRSAGATPGPACYGKGGKDPTVTDADLVCGALNPDYFLGGRTPLDRAAAEAAIECAVARPLGTDLASAAAGINRIVDARITDAIRVEAAKKGVALAGFVLVPFGGAGPVHAAQVAADLGMRRVLVPRNPGAFSALGLLCTDVRHDYLRSELVDLAGLAPDRAEACFGELESRAAGEIEAEGLDAAAATFLREIDLRYAGQGYELRIALDGLARPLDGPALTRLARMFHERHAAQHGHAAPEAPVEVVSYRLRALVAVPKYELQPLDPVESAPRPRGRRRLALGAARPVMAAVWRREALPAGWCGEGPAIIEQVDATTVVPAGWSAECDAYGNLVLERKADRG